MEVKWQIALAALGITILLLGGILLIGKQFDNSRQAYINGEVQKMYNDINDIQTFFLMSDTYGNGMACLAFRNKLRDLDKSIWNLGVKLDEYRAASEQFQTDPFYIQQKKIFNENEVVYMMLLTKLKKTCNYGDQVVVSYYYKNASACPKCDDQSFVLTDINHDLGSQVSIFSYDEDLGIQTINLLTQYYNITQYPCVVIEEHPYCGMQDKKFILEHVCKYLVNSTYCTQAGIPTRDTLNATNATNTT